jgi:hypothetical protein
MLLLLGILMVLFMTGLMALLKQTDTILPKLKVMLFVMLHASFNFISTAKLISDPVFANVSHISVTKSNIDLVIPHNYHLL